MRPVTSPRLRGEVGICAHARRSRVRGGASDKPGAAVHNPKEAPHPDPLPASGARGNPRAVFQPVPVTSKSLPVLFSSASYAFRGGFLVRPFIIALTLGAAGAVFSSLEEDVPAIGSLVPGILFPSRADPQVAQAILTDIATSIMTVVSIVFAILLMTLTLASTQFSPRILVSFIR